MGEGPVAADPAAGGAFTMTRPPPSPSHADPQRWHPPPHAAAANGAAFIGSHLLIAVLAGKFTIALLRFVLTSLATLSRETDG